YDGSAIISNVTVDHVRLCVSQIRIVVDRWMREQKMWLVEDKPTGNGLRLQARSPKFSDQGGFQVTYEVHVDKAQADLTFCFVDPAGREHDPTDFSDMGTKAVLDALIKAARC